MTSSNRRPGDGASGGRLQDDVTGVGCAWMILVLAFELLKRLVRMVPRLIRALYRRIRLTDGGQR